MIASLPLFHRIAGRPVIVLGDGEAAEAKRRLVERAGGIVVESDSGARIAFVALEEPESAAERLRAAGVLVNVVDRPDLCDFTTPSILDRAPVLIAIGTGGASAGLAKALRLRLEVILPQALGTLAQALDRARDRLRARWPDAAERRLALDAALGEGGALDPLRDTGDAALDVWLADGGGVRGGVAVEIVLRGDDPDDLTLREARWLGSADVVAYEPGVPPAVLDRARADATRRPIAIGEAPALSARVVVILRRPGNSGRQDQALA